MPVMARDVCELAASQAATLLANLSPVATQRVLVPGSNGSGKTTLLKMIDPLLRGAGATVSWFNLWQHKEDVDPFASLLFALWDELDVDSNTRCPQGEGVESIVAAAMRQKGYPTSTSIRTSGWVEGGERALLRGMVENSLAGQAGSKANALFQVFKRVNPIANDTPKLQTKAVGTQIDAGN